MLGCERKESAAATKIAGSCGVIPAVLLSYEESKNAEEDELVKALFVASGIGKVVAENASIAGAFGGCQAEIGTAALGDGCRRQRFYFISATGGR